MNRARTTDTGCVGSVSLWYRRRKPDLCTMRNKQSDYVLNLTHIDSPLVQQSNKWTVYIKQEICLFFFFKTVVGLDEKQNL